MTLAFLRAAVGCTMMLAASLSFGCAAMTVSVDVYKGELINSDEAQLAEAVGIARSVYKSVVDKQLKREDLRDTYNRPLKDYLDRLIADYQVVNIDDLWKEFTEIKAHDPASRPAREETRDKLARALFRFGAVCQTLGRERALPIAITATLPLPGQEFFVLGDPKNQWELTDGIGLEEAGRWIMFLSDNAVDPSDSTTIARMMQSVALGHTATMLSQSGVAKKVTEGLDDVYWGRINEINITGAGDTQYVVVKDEVGNWHIKSILANQDEIVNAIFDGVDGMINILAARYNIGTGAAGSSDASSNKLISETGMQRSLDANRAERSSRAVQAANNLLKLTLASVFTTPEETKLRELVRGAGLGYAARIEAIRAGVPSTQPAGK